MAVEQTTIEDLDTAWYDILQDIARFLDWSYAALWTVSDMDRKLVWKLGHVNVQKSDELSELFYALYSSCVFTSGTGFAGRALETDCILWLSGENVESLQKPLTNQTLFVTAAGIRTIVCLPLASTYVLELGTTNTVRESEEWRKIILCHLRKSVLLHLRNSLRQSVLQANLLQAAVGATHRPGPAIPRDSGFSGLPGQLLSSPSMANEILMGQPGTTNIGTGLIFSQSSFGVVGEVGTMIHSKPLQQQVGSIYSDFMQEAEEDETFGRQLAGEVIPSSQLSVEFSEPSSAGGRLSSWATDSLLSQLEMNTFSSWTSMAEASTSPLDSIQQQSVTTSSALSSQSLAATIVVPPEEIWQRTLVSVERFIRTTTSADQLQTQQPGHSNIVAATGAGESLRGSSSRSSVRSQTFEDTEISSAMLESYADCHISEMDHGVQAPGGSSSTGGGIGESDLGGGASHRSSKETSPESVNPPSWPTRYGIHPRISSTTSQQQQFLNKQLHHAIDSSNIMPMPSITAPAGISQQQQRLELERQQSSSLAPPTLLEDLKPAGAGGADSTPTLVQRGNVLQLGNASGQVTEALPQEHDEAAFSHMIAERRRRNKQNENFAQLKALIPATAKMDKASLLAATIAYINSLQDRIGDLEETNQRLKLQLLGAEQQIGAEGPGKAKKGSPTRVVARSPNTGSPNEEDKIQASPDGDGNVKIEIRNPCTQPDIAIHIFDCLKYLDFKVINANVSITDSRIHASIIVKMKRKNLAAQSEVCAEVEKAITACLNNLG